MSLSPDQQRRTGLSQSRFDAALNVTAGDPADVWLLRDVAETAAREAAAPLTSYSVLTESARRQAAGWFGVGDNR